MSYKDLVTEDRRYLLLKALSSAARYEASANLLQSFLDSMGQKVSTDLLEGDLAWLSEQGLIGLQKECEITIAILLPRGEDIATGRSVYPGVRRPRVGEL